MDLLTVFKALSNETRLNILLWLKSPEAHFDTVSSDDGKPGVCVGLIEKKAGVSQSTTSHYLSLLQRAGLVVAERRGQWTYYRRDEIGIAGLKAELDIIL
ncbi:ArsR/SmtB family transcription factor [Piscirickettsia litoralis]|uniref:Transcriptional regulator n=1 Tax=Piscirickettsia litoralis TaxID=1891921 RepID=A0ABX3A428_9GAMM|nr:metalloregulator ArsR/SmtB family transcription factor [Piscirickettsia litoralis]ODN43275.1 transcriptional regulator [Piscirickettsia litoralis]